MEIQAQVQKFSFVNQRNDRERGRGGIRAKRTFPITPITPGNKKKKKKKEKKEKEKGRFECTGNLLASDLRIEGVARNIGSMHV